MKTIQSGLQEFLNGGQTTMAHCWKVTRKDGRVQGFTEHDEDITLNNMVYKASSGFTATQIQSTLGLSVDNLNAQGALSADTINEDDLAAGRYDDAQVELYWVNFENTEQSILLNKGNIGQVEREELAFSAELRSQSHRLQQKTGRVYQRTCDAILGDSRCRVSLAAYTSSGVVDSVENRNNFFVTGISNDTEGFYSFGLITFFTGNNRDLQFEIRDHVPGHISLWEKTPFSISHGDRFTIIAGCDKRIQTCHNKFSNTLNFQGFNLIPGIDYITRSVVKDSSQQGQSIFNETTNR